ncbi:MAG TPA: hypothetical protein VJN70_04315 [Gemmatimonadaceae bacterium]|nr:hypothetical protein [Gemmatimonadaceae bacterium]
MPVLSSRPLEVGPSDPELAAAGIPDTSPTWELELLISGAVLFALFQIPGVLTSFFARIEPQTTSGMLTVLFFVQMYVKAIIYALIASFVVHLIGRAYWVGLVGLHSVFPNGARWENFKSGPVTLEVFRSRLVSLPEIISKTDNFCSVIFSFAFLLVLLFAFTVLLTGVFGLIGYAVSQVIGGVRAYDVFLVLATVMVLIPMVASFVDRRVGASLGPNARAVLRRVIVFTYRGTVQGVISPIFVPLLTNVGRRKIRVIFFASLFGVLLFVTAERMARSDRLSVNSYDYFGASDHYGVNYRFYENQRSADDVYGRLPSIQSDIVTGSYVKLFIPYVPRQHNPMVAKSCPSLKPLQERGVQLGADAPIPDSLAAPVLQCLGRIHAVTLDGAPQPDVQFRFYEHPESGIKGILTYIPADSLARGQHVITVQQVPSFEGKTAGKTPTPWVIPFWR